MGDNRISMEEAMRRGKMGRLTPDDFDLLSGAFAADPEEYSRRKRAIDEVVIEDERKRWGP